MSSLTFKYKVLMASPAMKEIASILSETSLYTFLALLPPSRAKLSMVLPYFLALRLMDFYASSIISAEISDIRENSPSDFFFLLKSKIPMSK